MSGRRSRAQEMIAEEDAEIAARLRAANDRLAQAEAELEAIKEERAGIIGEAAGVGWSDARIGRVLGLSKQRIAQLRKSVTG
jgi:uncharacterized protein (UPF0335 family)